jgi:hypothetical protein
MADAPDSKSGMGNSMCGFDPRLRYLKKPAKTLVETTFRQLIAVSEIVQRVHSKSPKYAQTGVTRRSPFWQRIKKPPEFPQTATPVTP